MSPPRELDIADLATPLPRGATLIEASAGTGKTYTLAAIFLRLILEHNLAVREILVTTFTIPATAELRDRIRRALRAAHDAFCAGHADDPFFAALLVRFAGEGSAKREALERALHDFDEAAIFTIHGFCQRVLTDCAFESGAASDPEFLADPAVLIAEVGRDYWRRRFYAGDECRAAAARLGNLSVEELTNLLDLRLRQPLAVIIPEQPADALTRAERELPALLDEIKTCWARHREEVRGHLLGENKWAKVPYSKPDFCEACMEAIEFCLGGEFVALSRIEALLDCASSRLAEYTRKRSEPPRHPFFDLCEKLLQLVSAYAVAVKIDFLGWAPGQLEERKLRANVVSYNDLLSRVHAELASERGPALAKRLGGQYRAALIDEFQDTDALQNAIFERIFHGGHGGWLFLIGDPKQAIFSFRGADVFTYLKAGSRAGAPLTLGTNFRSTTALVTATNSIFARNRSAFVIEGISFRPVRARGAKDERNFSGDGVAAPLRLWVWPEEKMRSDEIRQRLSDATAAEIARLLDRCSPARLGGEPVIPKDIAVITATNAQAQQVQDSLAQFGVPSVLLSNESVFASTDARELLTLLSAILRPADEARLRAALLTELIGFSAGRLQALSSDHVASEKWFARFQSWQESWAAGGFIAMFSRLLRETEVRPRLLARRDGERRLTNLLQLSELVQTATVEEQLSPAGAVKWLAAQIAAPVVGEDGHELRLERDDDAVRIVTVHKSKGLEYNIVFCPFAWSSFESRNPKQLQFHGADDELVLDLASPYAEEHLNLARRESLAEKVRLLYVALTRARSRCDLVTGWFSSHQASAVNWLLHPLVDPGPDLAEALDEEMKRLGSEGARRQLEELAEGAAGQIALVDVPSLEAPRYTPPSALLATGAPRLFHGRIERDFCVSSFSSLTEGASADLPDYFQGAVAEDSATAAPEGIHAFPAGARPGLCLHEIFERLDFTDDQAVDSVCEQALKAYSLDPGKWKSVMAACVRRVLEVELEPGLALNRIPMGERLIEREFHLPAQRLEAETLHRLLGPADAEPLKFSARTGWLKGFIDLVFRHGERFYVIDWKSNRLGPDAGAYTPAHVRGAMAVHHYPLQAQIYTLALHRYLRQRLRAYDYERCFGGVFYLFARGVDPARPDLGIWRHRPERSQVEAFDRWLEGLP